MAFERFGAAGEFDLASSVVEMRAGKDHVESLLSLAKLRCPSHGDMVMVQRRDGQILFWCGCTRDGADLRREEGSTYEKIEVKQ